MRKAIATDEPVITQIIAESFIDNPSVLSAIKNDAHKPRRIAHLASYAFKTALKRDGVYISSDNNGVAIAYRYNEKRESLGDYWNQLQLVVRSIGISRVFKVLKRESYIKKWRPQSGDFLYFWFFGVADKARGSSAAKELKDAIFQVSEDQQLPIYLETSVEQNKKVYQRYGFEIYHTWQKEDEDICIWFMKRECKI